MEGIVGDLKWGFCYVAEAFVLESWYFIDVG